MMMAEWLSSPKMWTDVFVTGAPLIEKVMRPVLVYGFLVVALRVFGKRELAQLNPFDLVVLLSLSNTVQNAIIGNDNSLTGGVVGALALLIANYVVVRFLFRHRRLDQLFEGKPTTLVDKGHLKKDALARELLTRSELLTVLHRQGFDSLEEVQQCVLEPGGTFYIQRKTPSGDEKAHAEVMRALGELRGQVDALVARGARRDDYN
ncbi:MAG: rane protein-like protein [Candidatus Solibacter sp.]|nr:rane protein-like protein [Candidatus Solibacter sp.]